MMDRLAALVQEHAPRAWPLWAGGLAAALALGLMLGPAARWEGQTEERLSLLAQEARRPAEAARPSQPATSTPAALPEPARSAERSARLSQLARRHGVQVQRLREQWDGGGQLQLSLSGRAPYASWRAFTAAALAADPAVSLDRLRLQRSDAAAAELDADTQWTFLHRGAGDTPPRAEALR